MALLAIYYFDHFTEGSSGLWNEIIKTVGPAKYQRLLVAVSPYPLLDIRPQPTQTLFDDPERKTGRSGQPLASEKFDPREDPDTTVRYLSYYTPGDEAGLGLRIFGILTWVMQTVWMVMATALFASVIAILVMLIAWPFGLQDVVWNSVFGLPVKAWNGLFSVYEIPSGCAGKSPLYPPGSLRQFSHWRYCDPPWSPAWLFHPLSRQSEIARLRPRLWRRTIVLDHGSKHRSQSAPQPSRQNAPNDDFRTSLAGR